MSETRLTWDSSRWTNIWDQRQNVQSVHCTLEQRKSVLSNRCTMRFGCNLKETCEIGLAVKHFRENTVN